MMSLIDYQEIAAARYCAECGGEIYPRDDYYVIGGRTICEACVEDARRYCEEEDENDT